VYGGGDGPEDGLDATYRAGQLDFREDAQPVIVHITDYSAHRPSRTTHSVNDVERLLRERGATYFAVTPQKTNHPGYRFDGRDPHSGKMLADRLGGVWMQMGDSDFSVFLEEIQRRLTERYAVTYRACNPEKGAGRRVDLYVDDPESGMANATVGYIAPTGVCDESSVDVSDPDGDGIPTYGVGFRLPEGQESTQILLTGIQMVMVWLMGKRYYTMIQLKLNLGPLRATRGIVIQPMTTPMTAVLMTLRK
jgi:hypothetical protein